MIIFLERLNELKDPATKMATDKTFEYLRYLRIPLKPLCYPQSASNRKFRYPLFPPDHLQTLNLYQKFNLFLCKQIPSCSKGIPRNRLRKSVRDILNNIERAMLRQQGGIRMCG